MPAIVNVAALLSQVGSMSARKIKYNNCPVEEEQNFRADKRQVIDCNAHGVCGDCGSSKYRLCA